MIARRGRAAAAFAVGMASLALAGCAPGPDPGHSVALPPASGDQLLAGVCPATVVIQEYWEPSADNGAIFQLVGPGATVDAQGKRLSGPLVADGRDTGVRVEIRSGGPATGFTPVTTTMYLDHSVTLGEVRTEDAIGASVRQPVTAVVAPKVKSPQVLMWDPASHPSWHGIADIGASNTPVVVAKSAVFAPMLVAEGLIKRSQIDYSYTGAPARFVTNPTIVQQAYLTNEPYIYQHEIKTWDKPVSYQLLADVGYRSYPEALSVRTGDLGPLSACLHRLVPLLQRAQIEYLHQPGPTNQLIAQAAARYNDGWSYSRAVADYAAATLAREHLVANDTSGPLGGMDPARIQSTINTFAPILGKSGAAVKPGLTSADIATNRFLDPRIRLN